jgi:hypothetical protein
VLQKRTLEMVPEHKVVLIPIKEFNQSGANHIDKVNYLLTKGIYNIIILLIGIISKNSSG